MDCVRCVCGDGTCWTWGFISSLSRSRCSFSSYLPLLREGHLPVFDREYSTTYCNISIIPCWVSPVSQSACDSVSHILLRVFLPKIALKGYEAGSRWWRWTTPDDCSPLDCHLLSDVSHIIVRFVSSHCACRTMTYILCTDSILPQPGGPSQVLITETHWHDALLCSLCWHAIGQSYSTYSNKPTTNIHPEIKAIPFTG